MRMETQVLAEAYRDRLYAAAFQVCKNPADAEDAAQEALAHPVILLRTVVIAAYRLVALAQAEVDLLAHMHQPVDNDKGGNHRVAIGSGCPVQKHRSYAGQAVFQQAGKAAAENLLQGLPGESEPIQPDGQENDRCFFLLSAVSADWREVG